eukprot:Clim_evm70s210 gene=Clim_evmTU70s210
MTDINKSARDLSNAGGEEVKLVLDKHWENQQIKAFTAWVNAQLKKAGTSIENIGTDFSDGLKLIQLLQVLSGDKLNRPEKGKMRIHKLQNLNVSLDFIKEKGVKLVGVSAEEICDNNLKLILGMIWILILRWQIQDISIEELSAKEGLLLWCQRKTEPYDDVNVQNFHTSFQDGLAFCALIHRHRPDLLKYNELNKANAEECLNKAFDVAEKELDIPKLLDAKDMISSAKPDERSVMTYVAQYYHAFSGSNKAEAAARRLNKMLSQAKEHEDAKKEYDLMASDLLEWIKAKIALFETYRVTYTQIPEVQQLIASYREYKSQEKPPKSEQKAALENHYATLQTTLRLSGRSAYVPAEGLSIKAIDAAWNQLSGDDKATDEHLRKELLRLEELERLAARFNRKADTQGKWVEANNGQIENSSVGTGLFEVLGLIKQHDTFTAEVEAQDGRIDAMAQIKEQLAAGGYHNQDEVNAKFESSSNEWASIKDKVASRKTALAAAKATWEQIDDLWMSFAKQVTSFMSYADTTAEDLSEPVKTYNLDSAKEKQAEFASVKEQVAASGDLSKFSEIASALAGLGATGSNPYTAIDESGVQARKSEIDALLSQREQDIEAEVQRQTDNDALCQDFAQKAEAMQATMDQLKEVIQGDAADSSEKLAKLNQVSEDIAQHDADYQALVQLHAQMDERMILENKYTTRTMDDLSVAWDSIKTLNTKTLNTVNNQIIAKEMSGVPEEKLQEYRQAYRHFDKNNNGTLDRNEFRACLLALGYQLSDALAGTAMSSKSTSSLDKEPTTPRDPEFDRIMSIVDPDATGFISLSAFIDFMVSEEKDTDTKDQILESFKTVAGDKKYVTEDDLIRELGPDMAAFCISQMEKTDEGYDYESFTNGIYA